MKNRFKDLYDNVLSKPLYWLPVTLCALVSYGFDMFNRSLVGDDMMREYYNEAMLHSRWGMVLWKKIMGVMDFSPFIDKFIASSFLCLSAVALSFLLFTINKSKKILPYTVFSCLLVSFPLMNEIWNFNGANFYYTGGLFLGTIALLVLKTDWKKIWRFIIAGLFLVLPVSSYEAAAFSYLTLFCFVIFYENEIVEDKRLTFRQWFLSILNYLIPLVIAIIIRFSVSLIFNLIFNIQYQNVGNVGIYWLNGDILHTLIFMLGSDAYLYIISGLVYFPITEYVLSLLLFSVLIVSIAIKRHKFQTTLLGLAFILSVYALSFFQGTGLQYRTSQTVALFFAFVMFLVAEKTEILKKEYIKAAVFVLLFGLSWHQSAYMNRIQGLNNQRSDNEAVMIQDIGRRILSDFDRKPVVFVSPYSMGEWITKRTYVDSNSWNGRIFHKICSLFMGSVEGHEYDKYPRTNIRSFIRYPNMPGKLLAYYGFDIEVISSQFYVDEATKVAREKNLRPYEIYDNGNYLIVQLCEEKYFVDYFIDNDSE